MIPIANPAAQYRSHKAEIDQAIHRVLDGGWYILVFDQVPQRDNE